MNLEEKITEIIKHQADFNSLFLYRELKEIYPECNPQQQKYLNQALRIILKQGFYYEDTRDQKVFRTIGKNTYRNRLCTSQIIAELAKELHQKYKKKIIIRDIAVSDGITTLDMAIEIDRLDFPVSIKATDLTLYLYYVDRGKEKAVFAGKGRPLQYEIDGELHFCNQGDIPEELGSLFDPEKLEKVSMICPEMMSFIHNSKCEINFAEEDLFNLDPDIGEADIIRIANLLVESTDSHRGYFTKDETVDVLIKLGPHAKEGAFLFLDNYREKIERYGKWRKAGNRWVRCESIAVVPDVLDGVNEI